MLTRNASGRTTVAAVLVLVGVSALSAPAGRAADPRGPGDPGVKAVLDQAPADAQVLIVVPSLARLGEKFATLNERLGLQHDQLDALLRALPVDNMPMTLSELDGYIVGVLACPEMIPPSGWLPQVWGETGEAEFPDEKVAEKTISAVMAHYNSVVASITGSLRVEPIYEIDPNSDEVMWEPWVDGFTRAMRLRPEAWSQLLDQADEETRATMIFLMAFPNVLGLYFLSGELRRALTSYEADFKTGKFIQVEDEVARVT